MAELATMNTVDGKHAVTYDGKTSLHDTYEAAKAALFKVMAPAFEAAKAALFKVMAPAFEAAKAAAAVRDASYGLTVVA